MSAKLKMQKLSPVEQHLEDVLPTMDVLDQFYDRMIRAGFGPLLKRRFDAGLLLMDAADVLALAQRPDPNEPNANFDNDRDGRRLKRYATHCGYDAEQFASIAYSIIVEWNRLTSLENK